MSTTADTVEGGGWIDSVCIGEVERNAFGILCGSKQNSSKETMAIVSTFTCSSFLSSSWRLKLKPIILKLKNGIHLYYILFSVARLDKCQGVRISRKVLLWIQPRCFWGETTSGRWHIQNVNNPQPWDGQTRVAVLKRPSYVLHTVFGNSGASFPVLQLAQLCHMLVAFSLERQPGSIPRWGRGFDLVVSLVDSYPAVMLCTSIWD